MRNYAEETEKRVAFIKKALEAAHADGIIFGNSGGKDSALVGILCKMACDNTEGIILPCSSKRNFTIDKDDGMEVAEKFGIKTRILDLTPQKELAMEAERSPELPKTVLPVECRESDGCIFLSIRTEGGGRV